MLWFDQCAVYFMHIFTIMVVGYNSGIASSKIIGLCMQMCPHPYKDPLQYVVKIGNHALLLLVMVWFQQRAHKWWFPLDLCFPNVVRYKTYLTSIFPIQILSLRSNFPKNMVPKGHITYRVGILIRQATVMLDQLINQVFQEILG